MKALLGVISAITVLGLTALPARASGTETFVGIGISISATHDSFQIVDLVPGAPAVNAGVEAGDWITAVDQKTTVGLKLDDVVKMIGGDVGTQVTLTLRDDKTQATRDLTITRAVVTIQCVLQGNISLSLSGTLQNGTLNGFIGQDSVFLNVMNGQASGMIDGQYVNLTLSQLGGSDDYQVTGFIESTYIQWQGFGSMVTGNQACIPQT
jgi:hypothetical protein